MKLLIYFVEKEENLFQYYQKYIIKTFWTSNIIRIMMLWMYFLIYKKITLIKITQFYKNNQMFMKNHNLRCHRWDTPFASKECNVLPVIFIEYLIIIFIGSMLLYIWMTCVNFSIFTYMLHYIFIHMLLSQLENVTKEIKLQVSSVNFSSSV